MDLTAPLRTLVPSLDSAVLQVLAGTESGLGVTRIATLAGRGSRTGHLRVLERLVEHGLVIADPTNKGHVFRLNRDHLLVPALLSALDVRRLLLDKLTTAVGALAPAPVHASVFGSFARGEGNEDSDIDLLIVTSSEMTEDEVWERQMRALERQVLAWTGNSLESLVFSVEHLGAIVTGEEPLVDSLRAESRTLLGPEFTALLESVPKPGISETSR